MTKKEFIKKMNKAQKMLSMVDPEFTACKYTCSVLIKAFDSRLVRDLFTELLQPIFGSEEVTEEGPWLSITYNTATNQFYRLMCLGVFKEWVINDKLYLEL